MRSPGQSPSPTGPASLADLAESALLRLGDAPALAFEGTTTTAAQLHAASCAVAGGLRALGVAPGDRVVVLMTNRTEVVQAYLAVWRSGAAVTPVLAALTPPELRHVLLDSGAVAVLVSADRLALVREAARGLPVRVVVVPEAPDEEVGQGADLGWADLLAAEPLGAPVPRGPQDAAALLYTGGTTGRSKGVVLTHGGFGAQSAARAQVLAASGTTGYLVALPLSHVFGLMTTLSRLQLQEPGLLVLQRRFDARGWLDLVEQHRVEAAALVPSMLSLLLREDLEARDLSTLRYVSTGGAPLAVGPVQELERRVPGVVVCDGYGCTECSSTATMNPLGARRLGSVGLPLPGTRLQVVDDDGRPLPAGQDGEVCISSPGVMAGYWKDPEATAAVVVDGWLRTGDVGHLDDDGYLWVVDRKKDLVIRGGFNVFPRDVEDVLLAHPAVAVAACVGRPDEVLGEEVVAFAALREGTSVTAEELLAHCAASLAAHKRPREVRVVGDVPLTSVGKVDRKALRAAAAGGPAPA